MIYYFSGTGNSKWVAERLAEKLGDDAVDLARAGGGEAPVLGEGCKTGLVFPVYAWRAPEVVESFARALRVDNAYVYAVCTYKSDAGDALSMLAKCLPLASGFGVAMPGNFVVGAQPQVSDPGEAREIVGRAGPRIDEIAGSVRSGRRVFDVESGRFAWLKSHLVSYGFNAFMRRTRPFRAEADKCTSCGFCADSCSAGAIVLERGKPVWTKPTCFMCMGCINGCPRQAIEYGGETVGRERYRFPVGI